MKPVHSIALFRLSVLGSLVSREYLAHGELKKIIQQLASVPRDIPGSKRVYLSEKTIEAWYYAYVRAGGDVDALAPKVRNDLGSSKLALDVQDAIIAAKKAKPKRSINTIIQLLEEKGLACKGVLNKSTVYRLLKSKGLNQLQADESPREEHRAFVAEFANDLWQSDVMHGPKITVNGRARKTYLISFMDDASRLLTHSAFYLDEGAVAVESVLKQAILKRGLPKKLIIDNGAAYRSNTLQSICARLKIQLVYCRPYHPEGKGKLERWHRSVRDQFLNEIDYTQVHSLEDLNVRLWAWLGQLYHVAEHSALEGLTPQARYQRDLNKIRPLGIQAEALDDLFSHRHTRKVRKDGTVSFNAMSFEVDYELTGKNIVLVIDPLTQQPFKIESKNGKALGAITPLDAIANNQRRRHRKKLDSDEIKASDEGLVELIHDKHNHELQLTFNLKEEPS